MKKFARIDAGVVVETVETDLDIKDLYHEDLIWVECSSAVEPGYTYDGAAFVGPAPLVIAPEVLLARMTQVVQTYIDAPAKSWGYDDAKSAVGYVGDPFPKFHLEGLAIRLFRSQCWQISGQIQAEVAAGMREVPTEAELLADLPDAPARPEVPL